MSHQVDCFAAALAVIVGNGQIKQRLTSAYQDHLLELENEQLPIPMRQMFADLTHLMKRVAPHNGEGPICASVRKMSPAETERCAQLMLQLYAAAIRHSDGGQKALPLVVEEPTPVPPFLVKSG
ncbi:hypothetical protein [Woeseia oceani]|uniref:Uncharacterized protein n=1 Tax=Woeseia oceani TaxID=1548547 RepID=A0A193LID0_9GAMM|nr:hypothetical protein [Woeseia oceani]ANO52275.1 hypothetical protein BA177_14735 [Woeseia oceani]